MIDVFEVCVPELAGSADPVQRDAPAENATQPQYSPRRAYVYVPDSCTAEPTRRYPVLYMFDGHNVFFDSHATYGTSWGMQEFLEERGSELIVAAVECNHGAPHKRLSEYSPFDFVHPDGTFVPGQGKAYMTWLLQKFKPLIDSRYPTLPDRTQTAIAGSSMGGLMSLYALCAWPEVFFGAAALSPAFGFTPLEAQAMLAEAKLPEGTRIYLDLGEREAAGNTGALSQFASAVASLIENKALVSARIVPGGEHNEKTWGEQLPFVFDHLGW